MRDGGGRACCSLFGARHPVLVLSQLKIDVAQLAEGAMGADFCGADGAFENAGDLGEGEFLEAREEQYFAVVAIEPGERDVEERAIVARGRLVGGVGRIVGVFVQLRGIDRVRRGAGFAEMIGGTAAGEMIHPRGEAAFVAIRVAVFQHALKHDLHEILRPGAIPCELEQKSKKRPVMAFKELTQRIELSCADSQHQGVVRTLFDGRIHDGRGARAFNQRRMRLNMDFGKSGNHGGSGT